MDMNMGPKKRALYMALLAASRAGDKTVSLWWDLSPALARELRADNPANRKLSEKVVAGFTRDATNNRWYESHQGLALGPRLQLGDGQHRCEAVVRSGKTIRIKIDWYPDAAAFERAKPTWDTNHTRTKANALELAGLVATGKGRHVTAILDAIARVDARCPLRPSNDGTIDLYLRFKASINVVGAMDPREFSGPTRAAFVLAHAKFPSPIEHCIQLVTTKANIPAGSAAQTIVLTLRDLQGGKRAGARTPDRSCDARAQVTRDMLALLYRHVMALPGKDARPTLEPAALRYFLGDHVRASRAGARKAG